MFVGACVVVLEFNLGEIIMMNIGSMDDSLWVDLVVVMAPS
jgi:hypothetical protein